MSELKNTRGLFVYELPKRISEECGIATVGLVQLTGQEEMDAAKSVGGNDGPALAKAFMLRSFASVDGRRVSYADGSVEAAWALLSPAARDLCFQAFGELHRANGEEAAGFHKSRKMVVG